MSCPLHPKSVRFIFQPHEMVLNPSGEGEKKKIYIYIYIYICIETFVAISEKSVNRICLNTVGLSSEISPMEFCNPPLKSVDYFT